MVPNLYYYLNKKVLSPYYLNYPTFSGNESQSNEINFELNKFLAMRTDKDVLALRMYTVFGLGDVPFNNLAVTGGRGSDLRGYTQGEHRGKQMLADLYIYVDYIDSHCPVLDLEKYSSYTTTNLESVASELETQLKSCSRN